MGRDADIRTTRQLPMPNNRHGILLKDTVFDLNGDPIVLPSGKIWKENLLFERICEGKGANPIPGVHARGEDEEHYHIYFY